MSDDIFTLGADALGSDVELVAFRGTEALGEPFVFEIWVTVPVDAEPAPADVLGKSLTLFVEGNDDAPGLQPTNGIITRLDSVDETAERALLRVEIRPKLWLLSLARHSRCFVDENLEAILKKVLEGAGLGSGDFAIELDASYPERAHVTQYKESDLDFVTRLMERDGAYYFFEHEDGAHKLVITDHVSRHGASRKAPIRYQPTDGTDIDADLLAKFVERRRLVTKTHRHTAYDPENPSLAIDDHDEADSVSGVEAVHHGAASDSGDAKRLAAIHKERALCEAKSFDGRGRVVHLRSGFTFEIDAHPRLNGEYLCVSLRQAGNLGARTPGLAKRIGLPVDLVYEVDVHAIAGGQSYRPGLRATRPQIAGFERAVVDGPADSDYAQLDDQGRYLAKVGFDEGDGAGDTASRRMRMTQPHAGAPEGWHLPLRKGTEVMIAFVDGDPDQPIIAGAVPNAETPAVVTSDNHTKNIFHSGGDNVVEIEDQDGAQWADVRSPPQDSYMHLGTPHDPSHYVVFHTDADAWLYFGSNQDIRVGGNLTEEVTKEVVETYNTSQTSKVTGPQDTTVFGDVKETYKEGHKTTVTDKVGEIYLGKQKTDVTKGDRFELYDSNQSTIVVGGADHTYDSQDASVLSAASTQVYAGNKNVTATAGMTLTNDSSVMQLFGPTTYVTSSHDWTVEGPGMFFTPSYTQIVVGDQNLQSNTNKVKASFSRVRNFGIGLVTVKFEAVGAVAGATGFKLEDTLVTFGAFGVVAGIVGIKLMTDTAELHAAPIKKFGC